MAKGYRLVPSSVDENRDQTSHPLSDSARPSDAVPPAPRKNAASKVEAETGVFEFIEGFYHRLRRHPGIDHMYPIEYERMYERPVPEAKLQTVQETG